MTDHTDPPRWVVQFRRAGDPTKKIETFSVRALSMMSALAEAHNMVRVYQAHPLEVAPIIIGITEENGHALYGNDRTIHRTEKLNVETDKDGKVVSVWFRCMALPFDQTTVDDTRAEEMRHMSGALGVSLTAVQVRYDE